MGSEEEGEVGEALESALENPSLVLGSCTAVQQLEVCGTHSVCYTPAVGHNRQEGCSPQILEARGVYKECKEIAQ